MCVCAPTNAVRQVSLGCAVVTSTLTMHTGTSYVCLTHTTPPPPHSIALCAECTAACRHERRRRHVAGTRRRRQRARSVCACVRACVRCACVVCACARSPNTHDVSDGATPLMRALSALHPQSMQVCCVTNDACVHALAVRRMTRDQCLSLLLDHAPDLSIARRGLPFAHLAVARGALPVVQVRAVCVCVRVRSYM
jgi:hypothetical protein